MDQCHIYKLPNELLLQILLPLPTPALLPIAPTSSRVYALILRILHTRITLASPPPSHSILLEAYHPSAKLTEPPYFCTYTGTPGLTPYKFLSPSQRTSPAHLGHLRNLYSRFRPYRRELDTGGRRVRRPPGDIPGSRTFAGSAAEKYKGEAFKQVLSLEGHERFTQLCAVANLAKLGPRNGLFHAFEDIEEGVIRVQKEWMKRVAEKAVVCDQVVEELAPVVGGDGESGKGKDIACDEDTSKDLDEERILWVTPAKNTGLKFRIREKKFGRDIPILVDVDEELPVSYELEFEELLIRTSHLLLCLEKSLVQEDVSTGKAIVFSW